MKKNKSIDTPKNKLCNIFFSQEFFVETMNEIEKQHRHDTKCSEILNKVYPESALCIYDNNFLHGQLIKIIKIAMKDNHAYSWIDYYMYDLDFGKEYRIGCVTLKDGKNFNLSNAGRLWELLHIK